MKLQMGATLQSGKYRLNQVMGRESLGATYLATQTLLQQPVVIKTLDPSLQITQSFPQLKLRFTEETRLLARCQHPSIVRVLDFFQEDGLPFLVMEYIPGQTLYDRVSTQHAPRLAEAEAIHYMRQIASALGVTHRSGLIHRNIRPEAIVRRQGTNLGILVGFGLAHDLAVANPIETNPFLPPDLNWSENRFAIDLYALAATLYFLLTGHAPKGESLEQHSWSPATKQAIFRGLSRDPEWQIQTADDWLQLLPNTMLPLMEASPVQAGQTPVASQNGRALTQNGTPTGSPAVKIPTLKPTSIEVPVPAAKFPPAPLPVAPVSAAIAPPIRRFPKFLTLTIATAGAIGLGFGLALRISAAKSPGTSLLHPVQPFAEKEWKGTLNSSSNELSDVPIEPGGAKSAKTPQKFVDPEIDRPAYIAPPKVETPPTDSPIQPRYRRSLVIEPIVPTTPKLIKPAPAVQPPDAMPEPITSPKHQPAAPSLNPAPVKPSTQEVAPAPPLNSTP